ncbi:MAG: hypothetical protein AB7G28_14315 [Pirellulales bacterium]
MKSSQFAVALLLAAALMQPVRADVLVDTGPIAQLHHIVSLFNARPASSLYQSLAGRFQINQDFRITSIEGLMYPPTGQLLVRLYADSAGTPGAFLSQSLSQFARSDVPIWASFGPALNWRQPAGTYWISFEPLNGSDNGGMPGVVQHPLMQYAFRGDSTGGWMTAPDLGLGVRVNGVLVPEPTMFGLIGIALGWIACQRRRICC